MSREKRRRDASPGGRHKKPKYDRSDTDEGFSGMERPSLLGQLRAVLDEYPDSGQILKELIQNAEDAEARDVKILFDSRHISEPQDLSPEEAHFKALKAPALCVYNDEEFTAEDWQGIKQIQMSIKANKPLKVGRFGLGFKSVFHLTDFPCIISGDSMLIINPREKIESRVCYKRKLKSLSPVTKKTLLRVLKGNVGFKEKHVEKGYFRGTILWFPLRTAVHESSVSQTEYNAQKVHELFQAFRAEASVMLLFLTSVNNIELQTRKKDTCKAIFSVYAKQNEPYQDDDFISKIKEQNGKIAVASMASRKYITIVKSVKDERSERNWLVVPFYKGGTASAELLSLCEDPALSYCPYVGLAVPLDLTEKDQGQIFCFLPLPMETSSPTGLKVHVNGFFALSQNRRHVKWPSAEQTQNPSHTDKALQWNQCLLEEVLPEAYTILIDEIISFCKRKENPMSLVQTVYRLLPDSKEVSIHWKPLLQKVHSLLLDDRKKIFYTPNRNGTWVQHTEAVFLDPKFPKLLKQTLERIYTDYKENIVQIPEHLYNMWKSLTEIETVTQLKLCVLISSNRKYENLHYKQKLVVLEYLLSSESKQLHHSLQKLKLLPVADGTFTDFDSGTVFVCMDQSNILLFPGIERRFLNQELDADLMKRFISLASCGILGLCTLEPEHFAGLLEDCLSMHLQGSESLLAGELTLTWLGMVWTYINKYNMDLTNLGQLPLIPHTESKTQTLLYRLNDTIITRSVPHMAPLPTNVCGALQNLRAVVLSKVPDFIQQNVGVLGTIIHYPTPEGICKLLGDIPPSEVLNRVGQFNDNALDGEKKALVEILGQSKEILKAKSILKRLELFSTSHSENLKGSLSEFPKLASEYFFPLSYPVEVLKPQSEISTTLALALGATYFTFEEAVHRTLEIALSDRQTRYSEEEIAQFMMFLTENHPEVLENVDIKKQAKQIRFLSSENTNMKYRACELFDPNDKILKSLFVDENKFPHKNQIKGEHSLNALRSLGLKQKQHVTEEDLWKTASKIEQLRCSKQKKAKQKAESLLNFLDSYHNIDKLTSPKAFVKKKCIPCLTSKPESYPQSLKLFAESETCYFESADEIYSRKYLNLIGSVASLAEHIPYKVEKVFNLGKQPPVSLVLDHLQNITESYVLKENAVIMIHIESIYDFLSSALLSWDDLQRISHMDSVWTGTSSRFQRPSSVCLSSDGLDLSPYRLKIPEGQNRHKEFFQHIGCLEYQNSQMMIEVLHEIKNLHDDFTSKQILPGNVLKNDLKIVTDILQVLKDDDPTAEGILLPVHTEDRQLLLMPIRQCTYCNADWLKDQAAGGDEEDGESFFYVHENIPEHTAKTLGVQSLTDRVLSDTECIDMNFGQTEPLTRRLKNLLKDYSDGFSVPKEILQNADDAGATVLKLLYDERENREARTCLIHEKMASLQGPALWAFNDALFSPDDLNNITKLSGATKEADKTKIGRFGLGFNAVYNITDVPSFISGNTVVIFDPHETYLGKPGLRADLSSVKNKTMLKKMRGQFKPFDGIFGCHLVSDSASDTVCSGTLFRFPLRTRQQATESEISALSYDPAEMKKFIKTFEEGAGNLLLFTQNVREIQFYHLGNSPRTKKPELIMEVKKNAIKETIENHRTEALPQGTSVLDYAKTVQGNSDIFIAEDSEITITKRRNMFFTASYKHNMSWSITWGFGNGPCEHFAKSTELKGLLPLAAIAIPKIKDKQDYHLTKLKKSGDGFYKKGHLFCFLPLPIESPFPVHINAGFALTSNRKYLCTASEDDKVTSPEAEWNETLATDAIPAAYIAGIERLQGVTGENSQLYFDLWPKYTNSGPLNDKIHLFFYKTIMQKQKKVFIESGTNTRLCFQDGVILDPDLRFHKEVGHLAFRAFLHFKGSRVIDIPEDIIKCIKASGQHTVLNERTISVEEFTRTQFLPNISHKFWKNEKRDLITLYILAKPGLRNLLKSEFCIPTKPNGRLKKPEDFVHPYGEAAVLYEEDDEVFPLRSFEICLDILFELGMKKDSIPEESVLERSRTVGRFADCQEARERCLNILSYLSKSTETCLGFKKQKRGYRYEEYSSELRRELESIAFLPVLEKPKSWPVIWAGSQKDFSSPSELYFEETKNLVSCQKCIIGNSLSSTYKKILKWLRVKGKSEVEIDTVLDQLLTVSNLTPTKMSREPKIGQIFYDLYDFLNRQLQRSRDLEAKIRTGIGNKCVLLVENRIISAERVAFKLNFDLSPHLYKVDAKLAHYEDFLNAIGVRNTFEISDGIIILKLISEKASDKKMEEAEAQCFGRVTSFLNEMLKDTDSLQEVDTKGIRLIGSDFRLHPPSDLCINDCQWLLRNPSMHYLNTVVNETVARKLGVRTKREADLAQHNVGYEFFKTFGQKEKLTHRLRRILSGYPCDSSLMKEMLQNADDAKATEMMIIKDFRTHPKEKLPCKEWSLLQGPAICIYNDSYFRKEDFQGIQQLGEGSKSDDPVQTGQYGIGFNAVYHLTDAPSFLTVGPDTDMTLCILDPTLQHIHFSSEYSPGAMLNDIDGLKKKYPDIFPCYLQNEVQLKGHGTLFRLPLRQKGSDISDEILTGEDINNMLAIFQEDMMELLLFLQSVRKISVASIDSKGKLSREFEVRMDISETEKKKLVSFQKSLQDYSSGLASDKNALSQDTVTEIQINSRTVSSNSAKKRDEKQEWLIIHRLGFESLADIPSDLENNKHKIGLLPRGGVALPLTEGINVKAKAFCVLPLPIETGLPMHVNGHFALDYETRRHLWNGSDYRKEWNDLIVNYIIVPAYLSAMVYLRDQSRSVSCRNTIEKMLQKYHELFPDIEDASDEFWKSVMHALYRGFIETEQNLFPLLTLQSSKAHVMWVGINNENRNSGVFNTIKQFVPEQDTGNKETSADKLKKVLLDVGMKIIETPLRVLYNFQKTGFEHSIQCVSPDSVVQFLRSHEGCHIADLPENLLKTKIRSLTNFICLVQFCIYADKFTCDLHGLPLALNEELTLDIFDSDDKLTITDYPDIVPGSASQVLHRCLYPFLTSRDSNCLERMDIVKFESLLTQTLHPAVFKTGHHISWPLSDISPDQVARVWSFLSKETKSCQSQDHAQWLLKQSLDQWSLIPAKITGETEDSFFLYPLTEGRKVLNFDNIQHLRLSKELQRLPVPQLWFADEDNKQRHSLTYRRKCNVVTFLVADEGHPERILYALASVHLDGLIIDNDVLLQYFSDNLQKMMERHGNAHIRSLLRKIPIFKTLSNSLVSVDQWVSVLAIENHGNIPSKGMEWISNESNTIILRITDKSRSLLAELGVSRTDPVQLYLQLVLPHFDEMDFEEKLVHLKYIRDNLFVDIDHHSERTLKEKLKNLRFIPKENGQYLTANAFYNSDNKLFQALCDSSVFPPAPFDKHEWKSFLKICGLQCEVTADKFVEFAQQVERAGKSEVTKEVERQSAVLLSHLSNTKSNQKQDLLPRIRSIRFILPFKVEVEKGREGSHLVEIQKQPKLHLVSFSESVSPAHTLLIWSTCPIITSASDQLLSDSSAREVLGISDKPNLSLVIKHFQNVSTSLSKMTPLNTSEGEDKPTFIDVVKDIMTSIYKYLQDTGVTEDTKSILQDYTTVYLPERGTLLKAEDTVINLLEEDEIKGYIEKSPVFFGQFFPTFKKLGAAEALNVNCCLRALENLHGKTTDHKLNPNELLVVEKSFKLLVRCLEKDQEHSWNVQYLYLPNEKNILKNTANLVVADCLILKSRVKSLPFDYLMDVEKYFSKGSLAKCLKLIPEMFRPKLLTSLVKETMNDESCSAARKGNMSEKYKKLFTGELISALVRLVHHVHCTEGEPYPVLDGLQVEERVTNITILDVPGLQTVLQYEGRLVDDSMVDQAYFLDISTDQELTNPQKGILYLNTDKMDDNIVHSVTLTKLATLINISLDNCLKGHLLVIEKMLQVEPKDLYRLLDELQIKPSNFISSFQCDSFYPQLGSFVEKEFHWMLDNTFSTLEVGEYVAVEIFDPCDEMEECCDDDINTGPIYIYAKVKKVLNGDVNSAMLKVYLLEVGGDRTEEVQATRIYKFCRESHQQRETSVSTHEPTNVAPELDTLDLEDILKDIRETLKDAWNLLDRKDRDRVRKRLYLKWHPDKNPGREDICNEICKMIQIYVTKLNKGEDVNKIRPSKRSSSTWKQYEPDPWYEHMNKRSKNNRSYHDAYKEKNKDSSSSGNFFRFTQQTPCPQPKEAKRWLRQARADLTAAQEALQNSAAHNWTCFKCQQSAEKSLKAMWYNRDSQKADNLRVHNLQKLAADLGNTDLGHLATELERVIVDFNRLRYPDRLQFPHIPADQYSGNDAAKAVDLAKKILKVVEEKIA